MLITAVKDHYIFNSNCLLVNLLDTHCILFSSGYFFLAFMDLIFY